MRRRLVGETGSAKHQKAWEKMELQIDVTVECKDQHRASFLVCK